MTDRRRFRPGFRARVLGSFLLLVTAATVAGLFFQRAVLLNRLDHDVEASLDQEREELDVLAAGRDPLTGQPFAGDVRAIFDTFLRRNVPVEGEVYLTFVDGSIHATTRAPERLDALADVMTRWASLSKGERGRLTTEAGPVRYLAVPLQSEGRTSGVFVVAHFVQGEREEIESSIRVSATVAGFVLLVAAAMAWFVAGRLLRPVRQLTETAQAISDTDLAQRISVEGDDEIAHLARTFNEMLDRLGDAFAVQRAFVDDAGHELRTPITIVRGHLELMGDDPEEQQETIALVTDELDRMSRIVDDLLLLAKAEQPDFVRPEPVEVSQLTTELVVKASALGPRQWELDESAEGVAHIDSQRVTQAVLNLARNAVEYTAPGASVALGSAWSAEGLRLWVRDTGSGVDPADRDRIFERFARGRAGRRRSDGAGLGLSIVRAIAAGHHGWVELDSHPGRGATFTIVLPRARHGQVGDAATVPMALPALGAQGVDGPPPETTGDGTGHRAAQNDRLVKAVVVEGFFTRLGFGIVTFALPLYALRLGLSLTEIGLVAGAKALVEPAVKPLVGMAVDRWGARRSYLGAVTLRFLAGLVLLSASSLGGLLAVRLLQGAASAARDPASITVLAKQARRRLGRTFSLAIGAKDLGNVSAGVIGGGVLAVTGANFTVLWLLVAVLGAVPVIAVWAWVRDVDDVDEQAHAVVTEETPDAQATARILTDPGLRLIALLGLSVGFTAHMTHSLFQVYASEVAGLSAGTIGLIYSASVVALLVVGPVAGWAGDRHGLGLLAGARGVANAVSSVIFVAFPVVGGVLAGRMVDDVGKAAFRPTWGGLVATAAQRAGPRRGRIAAGLDTALSVGEAAGPLVAGLVWDAAGFVAFFALRGVLGVATEVFLGRRLRHLMVETGDTGAGEEPVRQLNPMERQH